jgi:RNA polymerase sigma-70 factor (ECF subfamily)
LFLFHVCPKLVIFPAPFFKLAPHLRRMGITMRETIKLQPEYDAIGEALAAEAPALERTAYFYTGNPMDAEDLLQDTYVLALRFYDTYRQGTNLRAWLTKVMRNRFISWSRRKKLEQRVLQTEGKHALSDWSIGEMGRRAMKREGGIEIGNGLSDTVAKAMDRLRPEFREVIWLCDVEGLSYAEAARSTSRPIGTIMSRLHRGRRALRKQLGSRQELEAA